MTDHDPIAAAIREAQRLNAEDGRLQPAETDSALGLVREILQPAPAAPIELRKPTSPMSALTIDLAIRLRWVLRDINKKRTKLSPVSSEDLSRLIEMGLVEVSEDGPALTEEGYRAIQ
ncbi:MAG: hypothetical protein ABI561_09740 [Bradyrhizobium sp.]